VLPELMQTGPKKKKKKKVGLLHRKQPKCSFKHCGSNRLPWGCMGRIQCRVRQVKVRREVHGGLLLPI